VNETLPGVGGTDALAILHERLKPTEQGPIPNAETFAGVLEDIGLGTLEERREAASILRQAGLQEGFNATYYRLTLRVLIATGVLPDPDPETQTPRFKHSEDVLHTMSIFGEYWFQPLREYVTAKRNGEPDAHQKITAPAWREALKPELLDKPLGLQFLAGMTAHICGDLAVSLHQSGASAHDSYHDEYRDIVQQLISETTEDLADSLIPGHPRLRGPLMRKLIVWSIGHLREEAWRDSRHLNHLRDRQQEDQYKEFTTDLHERAARRTRRVIKWGGLALKAADLTTGLTHLQTTAEAPDIS
jgi:hypothetical protein